VSPTNKPINPNLFFKDSLIINIVIIDSEKFIILIKKFLNKKGLYFFGNENILSKSFIFDILENTIMFLTIGIKISFKISDTNLLKTGPIAIPDAITNIPVPGSTIKVFNLSKKGRYLEDEDKFIAYIYINLKKNILYGK
jgi:hypothetical protein